MRRAAGMKEKVQVTLPFSVNCLWSRWEHFPGCNRWLVLRHGLFWMSPQVSAEPFMLGAASTGERGSWAQADLSRDTRPLGYQANRDPRSLPSCDWLSSAQCCWSSRKLAMSRQKVVRLLTRFFYVKRRRYWSSVGVFFSYFFLMWGDAFIGAWREGNIEDECPTYLLFLSPYIFLC